MSINYKDYNLRKNQINAIEESIKNDFTSGIHNHATGTGKSWTAMLILLEYVNRYPNNNIIWLCERKNILMEQFSRNTIKERNFDKVLERFNILDFTKNKNVNWVNSINSSLFWNKPLLCIINTSFLASKERYVNIKIPLHLIIHDECHSIENKSTSNFYDWLINIHYKKYKTKYKKQPSIIGFSATPELISPLSSIISKYSIYDGFKENVILQPKIIWFKSEKEINNDILQYLITLQIRKLHYKKLIVWCGMIKECITIADLWKKGNYFKDFSFHIDFSDNCQEISSEFKSYKEFYEKEGNCILFCAVKHREGSDIPNIDGCIFMDKVEKRSERVFIQSLGRVLRRDKLNKKKYGLIIDVKAKSSIEICNRVQKYLKIKNGFPWNYDLEKVEIEKNIYFVNELSMREIEKNTQELEKKVYNKKDIYKRIIRKIPNERKYKERLEYEINMFLSKNIIGNIFQALEILEITKEIPHITRGSCGSSLLCYLLGISHIDPVKYNISFARFMNKYRNTLPDIDFDFPHYLRDEVFLKLYQKYGNKIARISNHNYYHEKSALRQALRLCGIRKFISKYDLNKEINNLSEEEQVNVERLSKELEGSFRGFSLHCGGIIYYPKGVPEEYLLENNNTLLQQVSFNKIDVSENKNFKIDILSSCGLSQLYYINKNKKIDFNNENIINDEKTSQLLCSGNNIGITLGETPLMRKAFLLIQPKNVEDVALCLSIIRPLAKDVKRDFEENVYKKNKIVYDDDAIQLISKLVGCDEEEADKLRRGFVKDDEESLSILNKYLKKKHPSDRYKIKNILGNLRKYGFCKAHAYSYAQLVWFLAYEKAHNEYIFWKATLKYVNSNYRKWVHIYEAKCAGVNIYKREKHKSIYAIHRNNNKKNNIESKEKLEQLRTLGYWIMEDDSFYPNCYYFNSNDEYIFRGLVACSRMLSYGKNSSLALTIGVSKGKYIDIIVKGKTNYNLQKVIIQGKGLMREKRNYKFLECESKKVIFI
jgi:superfamily II DNA or RNA helicase